MSIKRSGRFGRRVVVPGHPRGGRFDPNTALAQQLFVGVQHSQDAVDEPNAPYQTEDALQRPVEPESSPQDYETPAMDPLASPHAEPIQEVPEHQPRLTRWCTRAAQILTAQVARVS